MRFGPVPLAEAEGAILAHSVAGLRKGVWIGAEQMAALASAGLDQVIVARLDDGDLHEDAAATAIATALVPDPAGQGLRLTPASTGRVNLHATGPGIVVVDAAAVAALNAINPMMTLATLAPFARSQDRGMVATVKIIAYAVPAADVEVGAAAVRGAIRLAAPIYKTATLIETTTTAADPAPKGRHALIGRLDRFGVTLTERIVVRHETAALAAAIATAPGEVVFILTASATSDPLDVGPGGLRAAGGLVERVGMPVDPGNLLFLGRLGQKPVIGLPGCARSPALNGADWVLERVICGLSVTAQDIAGMGVGGLLTEIPTRPRPREG